MTLENRPLVLVADHQPEITKLVALSQEDVGVRVISAHDGPSAWDEGAIRTIQGLGSAYDPKGSLPRMQSRRPRPQIAV